MKIRMKKLESCLTEATVILWRIATFKIHWDIIRVNFLSRNHKFMVMEYLKYEKKDI